MTVAIIILTKDNYLKDGILYFLSHDKKYECFESFSGWGNLFEIVQKYNHVYIICDNDDYFFYSLFFSGSPVKCICADNITIYKENSLSIDYTNPLGNFLRSLNGTEREILRLYFVNMMKIKEISKVTGLSVSKIYYRIRMIKIKFGVETTRKLPVLLRDYV